MTILCSGSVAVDHIMVYRGRFRDVIRPERLGLLNVSFHVPQLQRSFGGSAANIAFNLRLLGEAPRLLATVGGEDFGAYAEWLDANGVSRAHLLPLAGEATAGAYIITDEEGNQITGFHAGAMERAHEADFERAVAGAAFGVVSPNSKRAMTLHARACKHRALPCVVDPGQGLPLFDGAELRELLTGAACYVVNDFEWSLTRERTGLDEAAIGERVGAWIVTRGEEGSTLHEGGVTRQVAPVRAARVVDPTGCGDAYRAGLLRGLRRGASFELAARMGSLMGALLVERQGTQSLTLGEGEFAERFRQAFGEDPA